MGLFDNLFKPPNVEKMKAEKDVEGLIEALNYKRSSHVRERAAEALGDIKDALVVEPLILALKDAESNVRKKAAKALENIGEPALEPLIQALNDKYWDIRRKAAEALGEIGDARAVEPLIQALNDEHWDVRRKAAWALGEIGDARAVEPLMLALKDEDEDVRERAAEALGNIRDARAVEPPLWAQEKESLDERINRLWESAKELDHSDASRKKQPSVYTELLDMVEEESTSSNICAILLECQRVTEEVRTDKRKAEIDSAGSFEKGNIEEMRRELLEEMRGGKVAPRIVKCSICGKQLEYLGNPLDNAEKHGSTVTVSGGASYETVKAGFDHWLGTVCVSCGHIYCPDCLEYGHTPCPKCGRTVKPAQLRELNKI